MKIVKRDISAFELSKQNFYQRFFFCFRNQKYNNLSFLLLSALTLPMLLILYSIDACKLSKLTMEFDDKISFENVYILELGK